MYQLTDIRAQVHEAGASPREIRVHVLDLHETGGRFVLRGYLHPGTRIDITLPTLAIGENIETAGVVAACAHHAGMDHVVTVQFNESIDLPAVTAVIASSRDEDSHKNSVDREFRVLLIDAIELDRAVLSQRLSAFSIRVTAANHLGAGIDQLKMHHFDAVLLDDAVEDVSTPEDAVSLVREGGFKGPIILSTDRVSLRLAQRVREQGADVVIIRPTSFQLIGRVIRSLCMGDRIPGIPQLFERELFDAACERDLVSELSRLGKLVRNRKVVPRLLTALRGMASVGSAFGLTMLGRASEHLLRRVEQSDEIPEEPAAEMQELIRETAGAIRAAA